MKDGTVYAIVGGIVAVTAFVVIYMLYVVNPPPVKGCPSGSVGTFQITAFPTPMPSSPAWTPSLNTSYCLLPTTNYAGSFTDTNGTGVATNLSGVSGSANWSVGYSSLEDWAAIFTSPTNSSDIQVYIITP